MNWKKIAKFFPIIGIGLFVYLLIKLNVVQIFSEIGKMNLFYIPLLLVMIFVFFSIQTLKWFVIARKQKINLSFAEALKINFMGNFYGFVTPGKLGSAIRVNYLKDKGAEIGKGASNFVIDKALDLISLFLITVFFGLFFYREIVSPYVYCIFLGLFLLLFLFFYNKRTSRFILRIIHRKFVPEKWKEKSKALFESFYQDRPSFVFLAGVLVINLICWIFNYAIGYVIGLSLGINIGFMPFLIILPISTAIAQIPITINGFGTRELTMIKLFAIFGVDKVKIFSMSLIGIFIMSIIPSVLALIFIGKKKHELHNFQKS